MTDSTDGSVKEGKPPDGRRERQLFLAFLLLALLVRLPFLTRDYHLSNDMGTYRSWVEAGQQHGLAAVYANSTANYPPVLLYAFALVGWVESRLPIGEAGLIALIKLPAALADVGTAVLIAWALGGQAARVRLLAFAAYVFNPAVWYVSVYWGQTDSLYAFFLVAAVVGLARGAVLPAWAAYTLALATKIQSLPLALLLFVVTLRRYGWRKAVQGMMVSGVVAAVLLLPWLATGRVGEVIEASLTLPNKEPRIVVSAYNLWFLVRRGYVHLSPASEQPANLPWSYREISVVFFATAVLLAVWLVWRQRGRGLWAAAALLNMIVYMLPTDVHERYLFGALPFLLLAAGERVGWKRPFGWLYLLVSLTYLFNLVTVASPKWLFNGNLIVNIALYRSLEVVVLQWLALLVATFHLLVMIGLVLALAGRRYQDEPTTGTPSLDDPAIPAG